MLPELSSCDFENQIEAKSIVTIVIRGLGLPLPQIMAQIESHPLTIGIYKIMNVFSGKCLCEDTHLVQTAYSGEPSQHWVFSQTIDGLLTIMSIKSTRVLDVSGGSNENGTIVITYSRHGSINQSWNVDPVTNGAFTIRTANGKCLDVSAWELGDGCQLVIWDKNDGANQHWKIIPIG